MDHYRLKTLEDIHNSLMSRENGDCRDEVLALCDYVGRLEVRLDAIQAVLLVQGRTAATISAERPSLADTWPMDDGTIWQCERCGRSYDSDTGKEPGAAPTGCGECSSPRPKAAARIYRKHGS
jgi:hypothetical protein